MAIMRISKGDTLSYGKSVKTDIVVTSVHAWLDMQDRAIFNGLVCGKASTDIQTFYLDQVTKNYTTGEVA
jgi:hypothetical protein